MKEALLSIIVSQIGYRPEDKKIGIIRCSNFRDEVIKVGEISLISDNNETSRFVVKDVSYWGEKWGIHFWVIDFSECKNEGEFYLELQPMNLKSSKFRIKRDLFTEQTLIKTSVGQLDAKAGDKYGWQDCGSDLRAVEGHAAQLLGLIDYYEASVNSLDNELKRRFKEHIHRGADYLVLCQRDEGYFVNEYYSVQDKKSWILGMMATIALARTYEITDNVKYLDAAKKGWNYCNDNIQYSREELLQEIGETRKIFGKYSPWVPPRGLRCRDKLLVVWAGTELYKNTNDVKYKIEAIRYAAEICDNYQDLDYSGSKNDIYGNFYAWENSGIHQKSWEHVGWGYNCGTIFPDELNGFMNLLAMFPEAEYWLHWRYTIRQYAYGYLKPTSLLTPFGIYPLGLFEGEVRFFGPSWHGFNGMYGRIARTSMLLSHLFEDREFEVLAGQNMQWVAGLNAGKETSTGSYEGVSFINGVGQNFSKSWTNIEGSISNGFCANPQFKLEHLDDSVDGPAYLNTEDWIVHNGGWLNGLSLTEKPFLLKIKTQYRGKPVQAEATLRIPEEYTYRTDTRGRLSISELPVLKKGTVILNWNEFCIEYDITTLSGYRKSLIVDFSDFIEAFLCIDHKNRKCILRVLNKGKDKTDIQVYLRSIAVRLSEIELKDVLESGETKEYSIRYQPVDESVIKPYYVYAEVAGNNSNAVCEVDWKEDL